VPPPSNSAHRAPPKPQPADHAKAAEKKVVVAKAPAKPVKAAKPAKAAPAKAATAKSSKPAKADKKKK
jgi:hypothetical protein